MHHEACLPVIKQEARETSQRMEDYMEDQLVEGGFMRALSQFIDDHFDNQYMAERFQSMSIDPGNATRTL